ncbi:Glycosyl hydrolase family 10 [Chitinophaga jiangningensis]|uniref:Beta-xylanase n=1 Tax=Chitinophaga jiangningensis TaxID=1419482 RepID=A0A1M7ISQ6_9BACT|nr:endo-1,4-beta-xylanase [Chitinophaga jiangningensis]SHM43729.1 Glycosyl hydrolase family 10 [Chitinophaga jiangningensis]
MNKRYKPVLPALALAMLAACTKYEPLAFSVQEPESAVVQEDINSYKALKSYINRASNPDFKLGVALSLSPYVAKGVMYRLANRNFDELVLGYEMKHGAVVQADGKLALDNVTSLLTTAKGAGMSVYGHTLCWHANQNAAYLNGLIAPLMFTSPAYTNDLNRTGLLDGSFTSWTKSGTITMEDGTGMNGGKAIKLVAGNGNTPEALQLITPAINAVAGHKYEIICYVKSDQDGEGRIAFEGLRNNTPFTSFSTNISWKEIKVQVSDITGSTFKVHFDLGYKPGVTYYLDVNNIYVYDTQGTPSITNLVKNGDFETGSAWGGWGTGSTRGITADGMGVGNKGKAFYVTNTAKAANYWDIQTSYAFDKALDNGETYNLSFWVKGTAEGIIRPELQSANYASNGFGQVPVTKEWKQVTISTKTTAADRIRLIFSYGEFAGTVYIDDVVLSNAKAVGSVTTTVQKSAAEKEVIIGNAMESWIAGMVTACKNDVHAWDAVNEPMDDGKPAELKTGVGKTLKNDEFYWQDYLGKDYAVKAFQLARKYGNATDKLFINDYNLEYSLDKCRGLIAYVQYLESKGVKVDGIGTQMHISTTNDKEKIAEMFRLLAATGKLIKVSEMDIGVGVKTAAATPEHYKAQAELYQYVIQKYFELVPAKQRYGITFWSPLDSPASSSWRAGEPIGIWTEGYIRKLAYSTSCQAFETATK